MLNLSNAPGVMQAINAAGYAVEQRDNLLFAIRTSDGATPVSMMVGARDPDGRLRELVLDSQSSVPRRAPLEA